MLQYFFDDTMIQLFLNRGRNIQYYFHSRIEAFEH